MGYCKYLKKKCKNKNYIVYCNILHSEIKFEKCFNCKYKEYKETKKSTLKKKNPLKSGKMKTKSNKLAKLERNRFSVFSDKKDKCMFCSSTTNLTWHEIFAGRNRQNSMKYALCLRMCLYCHEEKQEDTIFNDFWHKKAQEYFEKNIGSREEFWRVFRRNYLTEKEEEDN